MDDDWDLHAVVRGCKTAAATASSALAESSNTPSTTISNNSYMEKDDYSFPDLDSLTFQNDDSPFFFPATDEPFDDDDINDPFRGLQEIICRESRSDPLLPTTTSVSVTRTLQLQDHLQLQAAQPQPNLLQQQQQRGLQREQDLQFNNAQFVSSGTTTTITFPLISPQPIRPRRRKNQQSKMVRQMTQDQLSADSWAWRKYGQKPIKGSPYPRNYYRCSTSKGCAARKQVERSPSDQNIYIVSYTGEHTHPRPTHRSSLAGSTRTKFSQTTNKPSTALFQDPNYNSSAGTISAIVAKPSCSSSSPASASSFYPSPKSPLMEGESSAPQEDRSINTNNNNIDADEDDDDDVLMIPNLLMDEDILNGFQGTSGTYASDDDDRQNSPLGDDSSSCGSLLFSPRPPWTPPASSSGSNTTKFHGGG